MKKTNKSVKPISSDIIRSKMIVDAAEKNAVVMNGEKIMNVPVDLCFVDKNYQREIRGTRSSIIMDMANNWDYAKAGYSQYVMKALAIIYEEQSELLPKVDKNLIPYMQKTNPGFFRDAAGTYGTPYVTKSRNVANIMMKLLCGDNVMTSKLKTLMAEANLT